MTHSYLLPLSVLCGFAGNVLAQCWVRHTSNPALLLAGALYALSTWFWLWGLRHQGLVVAGTFYNVVLMTLNLLAGCFLLRRPLTHVQMVAVVLAVVSVILLHLEQA